MPAPAPALLLRQSALLLGFVVALAAGTRFVAPAPAPTKAGSLPSSRCRVTVMPRQKEGDERAASALLQRARASLYT